MIWLKGDEWEHEGEGEGEEKEFKLLKEFVKKQEWPGVQAFL